MGDVHTGRIVSVEGGVVLVGWGAIMVSVTGYRHWLQVAPFVLGGGGGRAVVRSSRCPAEGWWL